MLGNLQAVGGEILFMLSGALGGAFLKCDTGACRAGQASLSALAPIILKPGRPPVPVPVREGILKKQQKKPPGAGAGGVLDGIRELIRRGCQKRL